MSANARLAGKTALITGAAGGIGRTLARTFVAHGARVALTDLRVDAITALEAKLRRDFGLEAAKAFALDVTDDAAWRSTLSDACAWLGSLSALVHNAGILVEGDLEQLDYADWQHAQRVNVDSVFLGTRAALPYLRASQPASVVVIASIAGVLASHNMPAYNVSKAASTMLSKSLALYFAKQGLDVRCNSVHPTFIDTPMLDGFRERLGASQADAKLARQIPLGRLGQPDDVALAALYLCSDESRFVTGSELRVDGGISAM